MTDAISETNIFETVKLENMKTRIEAMTKNHQIEILKILKNNPTAKTNENKSGIFVNLSLLPISTLEEIDFYLNYVHDQESSLQQLESQKKEFKETYFTETQN